MCGPLRPVSGPGPVEDITVSSTLIPRPGASPQNEATVLDRQIQGQTARGGQVLQLEIFERIAAHDPDGAAEAMFKHITEAWVVRRGGRGQPQRLRR
jgi:hypothetical protein